MIQEVKKLAAQKGYTVFDEPFKLNIWGFRANTTVPNSFDDEIHVFTNIAQSGRPKWAYMVFKATTDPGTFWLRNPMNPQGTAILNPGQYVNSHGIGLHRGKYKALVQIGKVSVTRDYDRDAILDFNSGKIVTGLYGINIHRASKVGDTLRVDKYSAGCQVFKNGGEFDLFMKLCEVHRKAHGNKFTYTLVDQRMESRKTLKNLALGAALTALVFGGFYVIFSDENSNEDE